MKHLILLISIAILLGACKSEKVIFKNKQFEKELKNFLNENKDLDEKLIYVEIANEDDIFEDVSDSLDQTLYLSFYYNAPEGCRGFYKSFKYDDKEIFLYNFSDDFQFDTLLDIKEESTICNEDVLLKVRMDSQPMKRYYFNTQKRLVEIKSDGSQRIVE